MSRAESSVEELVRKIERGELRLPEMQRRYVWRATRVRDLLDSLYRGYPSGIILLWETDEKVPLQDFAIHQEQSPFKSTLLLLDGQQRLTSLAADISGKPIMVRGRKRPIDLLFNLEHPAELSLVTEIDDDADDDEDELEHDESDDSSDDELLQRFNRMTFVVSTKKLESLPHWVKVSEIFSTDEDAPFLSRAGIKDFSDVRFKTYSQRLAQVRGIKKYMYRMDLLERKLSYDEVTEIFVRVNSMGAKLRSSDLALAQITAKWRGSLTIFQKYQNECSDAGFDIELGLLLKTLVAFATGQSRFHSVGKMSLSSLQDSWNDCVEGLKFAINFLKSNVGIDDPTLLSSQFLLLILAFYGHIKNYEITSSESQCLKFWALVTNAKGRYTRGSSDTFLDQDLSIIRQGGTVTDLIDRLRTQVGRLEIFPEDLEGRTQRSALFKTMFLAFRANGAKDWSSTLSIALDHSGSQHKLQFHHIFPKALLKTHFGTREIDDIANLAFIGGRTNRVISKKAPVEYFPGILEKMGTEIFSAQCIPIQTEFLELTQYKEFLSYRRKLICVMLNEFLNIAQNASFVNDVDLVDV